jgi:hypothetical protein
MNKERLQQVRDAIASVEDGDLLGFNMSQFMSEANDYELEDKTGHSCGTVACIAGWAATLAYKGPVNNDGYTKVIASQWLDLNEEESYRLFYAGIGKWKEDFDDCEDGLMLDEITKDDALVILDHAILTGEIKWELVDNFEDKVDR